MIKIRNELNGWIIARKYRYGGKDRFNPIGYVYAEGSYSGHIYVYPTYKCAEISLNRLRNNFSKFVIRRVTVDIN